MPLGATEVALIGTMVTFVGTVWKASSLATEVTGAIKELRTSVGKLEVGLVQLAEIPLMKQRLEALENTVKDEVRDRLHTLWVKAFSHDKHMAVTEAVAAVREKLHSKPDLEDP